MFNLTAAEIKIGAIALALAIFGVAIGYAIHLHDQAQIQIGRDEVRKEWNAARAQAETEQEQLAASRRKAEQEARDENAKEVLTAVADAADARDAHARLQQRFDALIAAARREASAARPVADKRPGEPGPDPDALLADVQRRIDDAAGQLAAYGDTLKAAGLQCERLHDAVAPPR